MHTKHRCSQVRSNIALSATIYCMKYISLIHTDGAAASRHNTLLSSAAEPLRNAKKSVIEYIHTNKWRHQ